MTPGDIRKIIKKNGEFIGVYSGIMNLKYPHICYTFLRPGNYENRIPAFEEEIFELTQEEIMLYRLEN